MSKSPLGTTWTFEFLVKIAGPAQPGAFLSHPGRSDVSAKIGSKGRRAGYRHDFTGRRALNVDYEACPPRFTAELPPASVRERSGRIW